MWELRLAYCERDKQAATTMKMYKTTDTKGKERHKGRIGGVAKQPKLNKRTREPKPLGKRRHAIQENVVRVFKQDLENESTSREHLQRAVKFLMGEGYMEEHEISDRVRERLGMRRIMEEPTNIQKGVRIFQRVTDREFDDSIIEKMLKLFEELHITAQEDLNEVNAGSLIKYFAKLTVDDSEDSEQDDFHVYEIQSEKGARTGE